MTLTGHFKVRSSIARSEYLHVFFYIFASFVTIYSQIVNTNYNDILGPNDIFEQQKTIFRHLNLKKKGGKVKCFGALFFIFYFF
jgi:hypothetical protein